MRTTALFFLFCSFAVAGDAGPLDQALEKFKSRDPKVRDAGQREMDTELRRILAPILKALDHDDPEVRRRARKALLALVPNAPVEKVEQRAEVDVRNRFAAARVQLLAVQALGRVRKKEARNEGRIQRDAAKKGKRFLASFGLTGGLGFGLRLVRGGAPVSGYVVHGARRTAATFGLRRGDIILKVNGLKIANADNMRVAFGDKPQEAKIEVFRGGKPQTLTAKPAERR